MSSTRLNYSSQRITSAVARSQNVLGWTCHASQYDNFTVLYVFLHPNKLAHELTNFTRIANPSTPTVLPAPLAIIGIEQNYQCSQEITQDMSNQPAGTGYLILLANPLNSSDVRFTNIYLIPVFTDDLYRSMPPPNHSRLRLLALRTRQRPLHPGRAGTNPHPHPLPVLPPPSPRGRPELSCPSRHRLATALLPLRHCSVS